MPIFSSLLFGLVASLDAFLVGITYGIRNIRISFRQNLLISLITLLGTCLSVFIGALLLPLFPPSVGQALGSIILIIMGIYYLLKFMIITIQKYLKKEISSACICNTANGLFLTGIETCLLGITLSLNNMGIGLSASIAGLPLFSAYAITFFFSIVFLLTGNRLGYCSLLQFSKKAADPISGLLLISLGLCQFLMQ